MWWNYGIWAGDPVDQRRPEPLNNIMPKHINWVLNSLDDGAICMGAILLIYIGKHPQKNTSKMLYNFSEKRWARKVSLVWPSHPLDLVPGPEYLGGDGCLQRTSGQGQRAVMGAPCSSWSVGQPNYFHHWRCNLYPAGSDALVTHDSYFLFCSSVAAFMEL